MIKPPAEAVEQMDEFVRSMHEKSGLLAQLDSGITLADAEEQVLAYVREHCADGSRPPLAGNTVATDRAFIARDMTDLDAFLHYRIVDVSSIKELSRRWYPRVYFASPAKRGNHRALADILESIEELRYYRAAIFVPPPGPESADAKALARRARRVADPALRQPPGRRFRGSWRYGFRGARCPTLPLGPGSDRGRMVGVAQLVEHLVVVQVVAGSSPVTHPKTATCPSFGQPCSGSGLRTP